MVLNPDPRKRDALERPPMPPERPVQTPWYALIAILTVGLVAWWFIDGPATDPMTTSSVEPLLQYDGAASAKPME